MAGQDVKPGDRPGQWRITRGTADLITDEPAGTEVLGDSAYSAGGFRAHLETRDMAAVIKPPPLQSVVPVGFILDDFLIDLDARRCAAINLKRLLALGLTHNGSWTITPTI